MIETSTCLIVTAGWLMPSTHELSHGAGQSRPVNSGKLLVACRRSMACAALAAPGEVVPLGDQVAERAALVAERDAAVHAAAGLAAQHGRVARLVDLFPVHDAHRHGATLRELALRASSGIPSGSATGHLQDAAPDDVAVGVEPLVDGVLAGLQHRRVVARQHLDEVAAIGRRSRRAVAAASAESVSATCCSSRSREDLDVGAAERLQLELAGGERLAVDQRLGRARRRRRCRRTCRRRGCGRSRRG